MQNKPSYALQSVDHALQLLQILRDNGSLRVSEAAQELGTARSTAHRLLAMLVYRDFAVQDEVRNYPGRRVSADQVSAVANGVGQGRACDPSSSPQKSIPLGLDAAMPAAENVSAPSRSSASERGR